MKSQKLFSFFCLALSLLFGVFPMAGQGFWTPLPPMPQAVGYMGAVAFEGKIYLFGGASPNNTIATNKAYLFDPKDSSYTALPDLPQPTISAGVVEVDRKIYVLGGAITVTGNIYYNTNYIFDPDAQTWETGPPMPHPRTLFAFGAVGGKIYIIGGGTGGLTTTNLVDVYDTNTKTWAAGVEMAAPRAFLASTVKGNKIYVIGGTIDAFGIGLNTVEIFDPATSTWASGHSMPTKRFAPAAVVFDDDLYVVGGSSLDAAFPFFTTVEKYDQENDLWLTEPAMHTGRRAPAAVVLNDKIYVFGGMDSSSGGLIFSTNTAEVFSLISSAPEALAPENGVVYPNPASDFLIFNLGTRLTGLLTLARSDGAVIFSEKLIDKQQYEFSVAGLPSGVYYWKWTGSDKAHGYTGKILVVH